MTLIIDQNWIEKNKNPKLDQSPTDWAIEYSGKTSGSLHMLKAMQKTLSFACSAIEALGQHVSVTWWRFASNLRTGSYAMGFPSLPFSTSRFIQSISDLWVDGDGVPFQRKVANAAMSTFYTITSYAYCITFIQPNPVIENVAKITSFSGEVIEVGTTYSDYCKASELEEKADGHIKEALSHSKYYYFLKTIKSVMSIVGTILAPLALLLLIWGFGHIPLLALSALSLIGAFLSIRADYLKKEGAYKVISFSKDVSLCK